MTSDASYLRDHPDGCTLMIRVQPGAKKTAITGIYGQGEQSALKVAVQAPPIEGRANEALIAFLAEVFDLPRSAISIAQGESGRSKRLVLRAIQAGEAQIKIQQALKRTSS